MVSSQFMLKTIDTVSWKFWQNLNSRFCARHSSKYIKSLNAGYTKTGGKSAQITFDLNGLSNVKNNNIPKHKWVNGTLTILYE